MDIFKWDLDSINNIHDLKKVMTVWVKYHNIIDGYDLDKLLPPHLGCRTGIRYDFNFELGGNCFQYNYWVMTDQGFIFDLMVSSLKRANEMYDLFGSLLEKYKVRPTKY